ncbi:nucleophile aminohydrolase [Phyllosticta citribraziliensis]|uniref:Nucleophile aminohydrolase n=1 Tax=Phyllosticta citribraziliensis TaxID=989973 RepID=A0ABR1LQJ1_9PEZI
MAHRSGRSRRGGDICAIFVHAGAGYHSVNNEGLHLQACNDAAKAAMAVLQNGGTAVDAVEIAIKVLEDREITNAGYGSNLAIDGVVECDAIMVDHYGRSGGVGAVAQIKNPISLARVVLDHTTQPLLLKRVPPNLLVAQGATDFAFEQGLSVLPHDALVSPAARERWIKWRSDLKNAERKARQSLASPVSSSPSWADDLNPQQEELVRTKMRKQHTSNMLRGRVEVNNIPATPSPASKHMLSPGSREPNRSTAPRPASLSEAAQNPLINSTQTVPTLASYQDAKEAMESGSSPDMEMSDVDDSSNLLFDGYKKRKKQRSGTRHDGSEFSDSESSGTLQLPSLTPSPPAAELPSAEKRPLPGTPLGTPTLARTSTNLNHVIEHAPLPPEPDQAEMQPENVDEDMDTREDNITDTVGAVAVDCFGNIACGASSGGIGMKYRGRIGPAALVGVGAHVVPNASEDKEKVSVATVTSGTGEHMATTMAATVCSERLYYNKMRGKEGQLESVDEEEVISSMIQKDFMGHPSVLNSNSAGAIGVLSVKKTRDGIYLYFGHNTDSFALASMHSDEDRPQCTMSRSTGNGAIAQGGRCLRYRRKKKH